MNKIREYAQQELSAAIEAAKAQHDKLDGTSEISLEKRIQQYISAPTLLTLAIYDLIDVLKNQQEIKAADINELSTDELNKILYATNTKT